MVNLPSTIRNAGLLLFKKPLVIKPEIFKKKYVSYDGSVVDVKELDLFYPVIEEGLIKEKIPLEEIIGKPYYKPLLMLVNEINEDIYHFYFFNLVEEKLVFFRKPIGYGEIYITSKTYLSTEEYIRKITKSNMFSPAKRRYSFFLHIDKESISEFKNIAYNVLDKAIAKQDKLFIRPKVLIEQYDLPIAFDGFPLYEEGAKEEKRTVAYVYSKEIDNFRILSYLSVDKPDEYFVPPNAIIVFRRLFYLNWEDKVKDVILHELSHFIERRIVNFLSFKDKSIEDLIKYLNTKKEHSIKFHEIEKLLNKKHKTSYFWKGGRK